MAKRTKLHDLVQSFFFKKNLFIISFDFILCQKKMLIICNYGDFIIMTSHLYCTKMANQLEYSRAS